MKRLDTTLLMTDLDGTLLPSTKEILPEELEAIRQFRQQGGKFAIATGRTLQAAQRYLDRVQADVPVILFNGAGIYDPLSGTMLDTESLPAEAAFQMTRRVLEAFPEVSAEILRVDGTYVPRMTEYEREHLEICRVEPVLLPLEEIPRGEWLKVLFAIAPEHMPELTAFIQGQGWQEHADFMQSEARFYEMLPKGVTKGSALRKYRRLCHMEEFRIVAAGDFDNDLEMLCAADIGACPSNAQPCVKEVANIQLTQSCETHAIAELIARIMTDL